MLQMPDIINEGDHLGKAILNRSVRMSFLATKVVVQISRHVKESTLSTVLPMAV